MRILMLNYEYPPIGGGASPITRALAEQLAEAGHAVDVVTMGYRRLPFAETFGLLRVIRVPAFRHSPVRALAIEMASYLVSAFVYILWLSRTTRYDLIHAHFLVPTGPLAVLLRAILDIPTIVTIHGSDVPGYNPDRFQRGHRLLAPIWRLLVRNVDAIISPSHYLAQLLQQAEPAHIDIIPYGFTPAEIPNVPRRKRILFVSRLFPRKGAHLLIEALAQIDLHGWEVIIAGDGPELPELHAQAQRLGLAIEFPGFVKGQILQELYASSQIFVLPSLRDNFPVVLLEALSAGCAVITSDSSGMPEVVGDAGLLVPAGNVEALRTALIHLMGDEAMCTAFGARAKQRISELSWSTILAQHLEVYQRFVPEAIHT
jgi:glycosyltransferase involved in cell wall biosynthesis